MRTPRLVNAVEDIKCPRNVGRAPVEFLVEPITQASDGLGQDEAGATASANGAMGTF